MIPSQEAAQAAWNRIEQLGGQGVWEREFCVVSLADSPATDDDLTLFADLPFVQALDISHTNISDNGLKHLSGLAALESLVAIDTRITASVLDRFQQDHPRLTVRTVPTPMGATNPFTGMPS